jgi:hypothetical protein
MLNSNVVLALFTVNRCLQEVRLQQDTIDLAVENLLILKREANKNIEVAQDNLRALFVLLKDEYDGNIKE